MIYALELWNYFFFIGDTLTAVMICISLRSIWRNRGSSLEVAEHHALLKFRRPLPALAFTGSEVEEAVIWASETNCFSTPRGGNSSELRKKSGFTKKNCLYFSHMRRNESLGFAFYSVFVPTYTLLPKEKGIYTVTSWVTNYSLILARNFSRNL